MPIENEEKHTEKTLTLPSQSAYTQLTQQSPGQASLLQRWVGTADAVIVGKNTNIISGNTTNNAFTVAKELNGTVMGHMCDLEDADCYRLLTTALIPTLDKNKNTNLITLWANNALPDLQFKQIGKLIKGIINMHAYQLLTAPLVKSSNETETPMSVLALWVRGKLPHTQSAMIENTLLKNADQEHFYTLITTPLMYAASPKKIGTLLSVWLNDTSEKKEKLTKIVMFALQWICMESDKTKILHALHDSVFKVEIEGEQHSVSLLSTWARGLVKHKKALHAFIIRIIPRLRHIDTIYYTFLIDNSIFINEKTTTNLISLWASGNMDTYASEAVTEYLCQTIRDGKLAYLLNNVLRIGEQQTYLWAPWMDGAIGNTRQIGTVLHAFFFNGVLRIGEQQTSLWAPWMDGTIGNTRQMDTVLDAFFFNKEKTWPEHGILKAQWLYNSSSSSPVSLLFLWATGKVKNMESVGRIIHQYVNRANGCERKAIFHALLLLCAHGEIADEITLKHQEQMAKVITRCIQDLSAKEVYGLLISSKHPHEYDYQSERFSYSELFGLWIIRAQQDESDLINHAVCACLARLNTQLQRSLVYALNHYLFFVNGKGQSFWKLLANNQIHTGDLQMQWLEKLKAVGGNPPEPEFDFDSETEVDSVTLTASEMSREDSREDSDDNEAIHPESNNAPPPEPNEEPQEVIIYHVNNEKVGNNPPEPEVDVDLETEVDSVNLTASEMSRKDSVDDPASPIPQPNANKKRYLRPLLTGLTIASIMASAGAFFVLHFAYALPAVAALLHPIFLVCAGGIVVCGLSVFCVCALSHASRADQDRTHIWDTESTPNENENGSSSPRILRLEDHYHDDRPSSMQSDNNSVNDTTWEGYLSGESEEHTP